MDLETRITQAMKDNVIPGAVVLIRSPPQGNWTGTFGTATIGRDVPTLIGHDGQIPGYMTFMGYHPNTGLTITIGTNLATVPAGEGSALTLLKVIMPVFYGAGWLGGDPAAAATAPAKPHN